MSGMGIAVTGDQAFAWAVVEAQAAVGRMIDCLDGNDDAKCFDKACKEQVGTALRTLQVNPHDVGARESLCTSLQALQHGLHGSPEACADVRRLREKFARFMTNFPLK